MTNEEREELIENIVTALIRSRLNGFNTENTARAVLAVAEPVIREECARIADEEANAMEEQLDNIIEKGTLGGRLIPNKFKRIFAHERKILIEGYEQIAAAIREGGKDEGYP